MLIAPNERSKCFVNNRMYFMFRCEHHPKLLNLAISITLQTQLAHHRIFLLPFPPNLTFQLQPRLPYSLVVHRKMEAIRPVSRAEWKVVLVSHFALRLPITRASHFHKSRLPIACFTFTWGRCVTYNDNKKRARMEGFIGYLWWTPHGRGTGQVAGRKGAGPE